MSISGDIYSRMIDEVEDYAILLLDREGNIETWNKGAEKIKGYTREEVIGKNFRVFYTEEDKKNHLPERLITEARENGKAIYEGWRVRKNGVLFWGSVVVTAINNEDGSLAGFVKMTRDLTEKKQAEERLLQFNQELERKVKEQTREIYKVERRFKALIENNYEIISLRDEDGNLFYQSPASEKIIGYTIEETKAMNGFDLFHPDDVAAAMRNREMAMASPGKPIYGTHRARNKQGQYIWMEGTVTNLLEDENVRAIVGNFRNVNERKLAEEKIKKANRLYAFISAINQAIVHVTDEQALYNEACRIAVEIGNFDLAWIGIEDPESQTLKLVAEKNAIACDLEALKKISYEKEMVFGLPLLNGQYHVVNDLEKIIDNKRKKYAAARGLRSRITLPIKKGGKTIGICNLLSKQSNFFDDEEIGLLEEISGDISFALDVFEKEKNRKEIRDKIAQSELRLKQAQEIAHVGSWTLDFATGLAKWSEESCRIYGLSPEDNMHSLLGWLSFVHPDDLDFVRKKIDENGKACRNYTLHYRIVRKDVTIRFIYSQVRFEYDAANKPIGLHGVVHDVTGTKEAERAHAQSETNLRLIMDLIPQAVFAKDINGKYLFVNKSFAALYGLTPDQMLDRTMLETIPIKSESENLLKQDREVILSGEARTIPEQTFTDANGNTRIFHTVKLPYTVASTNEQAVLGITDDITDQRKAEEERTKMINAVILRNKDLEELSQMVSHKLRAPVANIMGLVDLMQNVGLEWQEKENIVKYVGSAAQNLDNVIRDLNHILEIKEVESGEKETVLFEKVLDEIKSGIENLIKEEHVVITHNFSAAEGLTTVKSYLSSIFFNLISNSIKYHQPGVAPLLDITSTRMANKVQIVFKDNGVGIDVEKRGNEVFGLYRRFHHHISGKGIGLYMVKKQVEALGGIISMESEVNKGTAFTIEFEMT